MRASLGFLGPVIAIVATLAPAPARAGQCAPRILSPKIVTADSATIPKGGGLVVVQSDDSSVTAIGPISSWRFVDKKRRVAPTLRAIAPGLTVLAPVGTRLDNAKRGKLRTFTLGKDATSPRPAPTVKSIEQLRSAQGYRVTTYVSVELDQPVTADQFLVAYDKEGKVARSFGTAKSGDTHVVIYTAGECTLLPDGTQVTQAGDSITLAWLDTTGQLSARSAAVAVTNKGGDKPMPGP